MRNLTAAAIDVEPGGIPAEASIGPVHLKVADLRRATNFYHDVLGFDITAYGPECGPIPHAFLSAGGYHHHIALTTTGAEMERRHRGATPGSSTSPSVIRTACRWRAAKRVLVHGHAITSTYDDGGTESLFLRDPDGNDLELYYDRPVAQ